ncbi:hypothetical protein LguiB_025119 [Lonicera macranthoides]
MKKFETLETLSYLPPLTLEQLGKEIDYLIRMGWVPCIKFELEGTMMEDTGQCGSCPCLDAQTRPKYWRRLKRPRRNTPELSSVLSNLTTSVKAENEHKALKTRLKKANGNNNDGVTLTKYEISLKVHKRANGRE